MKPPGLNTLSPAELACGTLNNLVTVSAAAAQKCAEDRLQRALASLADAALSLDLLRLIRFAPLALPAPWEHEQQPDYNLN